MTLKKNFLKMFSNKVANTCNTKLGYTIYDKKKSLCTF